jgi:hypothetical protein
MQVIHDAFQSLSYWNEFETSPEWQGVMMGMQLPPRPDYLLRSLQIPTTTLSTAMQELQCHGISKFKPRALEGLRSQTLTSGLLLENGQPCSLTAPNMSTVEERVRDTTVHWMATELAVARRGLALVPISVATTRPSCADSGRLRSLVSHGCLCIGTFTDRP